jgi:hypothetical protein
MLVTVKETCKACEWNSYDSSPVGCEISIKIVKTTLTFLVFFFALDVEKKYAIILLKEGQNDYITKPKINLTWNWL